MLNTHFIVLAIARHRLLIPFLFFSIFTFGINLIAQSKIIYVKQSANGDGKSWDSPLGDLQSALKNATAGTQVWVSKGTYYPTLNNDRNARFEIPDGVAIYGGFQGFETHLSERDPKLHLTSMSGDVGKPNYSEDNIYTIIYTKNVSKNTLVDGFHIMNSCANVQEKPQGHPQRSGGAWYNEGTYSSSNPTIRNCYFSNNTALDGGAIYNNGKSGRCNVSIENCAFVQNIAYLDGGAIYNSCHKQGVVRIHLENCHFISNESNNGAGIFNYNVTGRDEINLIECHFINNRAFAYGNAVYDHSFDLIEVQTQNCTFKNNDLEQKGIDIFSIRNKQKGKNKTQKPNMKEYKVWRS